ncbi:hypothetical protein [Mycobacteroides abscessus]|uniref:hypothetical protein n=1 Tax=Mycobacteroides abscessus TaxID=36809 RepID=UPI0012FFE06D|nr:hypothetical protein [Mycobacteroides abscessus]
MRTCDDPRHRAAIDAVLEAARLHQDARVAARAACAARTAALRAAYQAGVPQRTLSRELGLSPVRVHQLVHSADPEDAES